MIFKQTMTSHGDVDADMRDELKKIVIQEGLVAWYPDYLALELTEELGRFVGINPNLILTFPGSDVGLETLCRTYLEPDDHVVVLAPTYENFYIYVSQTGAIIDELNIMPPQIPDVDFISNFIESLDTVKAVYMASPNNPLGYMVPSVDVEKLAARFYDTIFIIDEAYIEFADGNSCANLVEQQSNVVVARTFSKAFGMAGVRLGYLCAPIDIVNNVNKIRNGKNISMIAQRLGIFALRNYEKVASWIDQVRRSRSMFEAWCSSNDINYFSSQGNYVLFQVSRPNDVCSELKAHGIYVRNRNKILPGYVRATMGSADHVNHLISTLSRIHHLI